MTNERPFRIPGYEILEVLEEGPAGQCYRAYFEPIRETRFVRILEARFLGGPDRVKQLIRDGRALLRLRHPNLQRVYQFGPLERDCFYVVSELPEIESLRKRIQGSSRIPVQEALKFIHQAALGLQAAHRQGVFHGSISPDTLYIFEENGKQNLRVFDFDKTLARTSLDPIKGGDIEVIPSNERDDIPALGSTLYEILTGKLPGEEILFTHQLPADELPENLDRFVFKMLGRDSQDAFGSMDEVLADLEGMNVPIHRGKSTSSGAISHVVLLPGQLIAERYLIEKRIGQGGMGRVYKAIDKVLSVPVALKVIASSELNKEKVERFKREVIVARKVTHPNACRIYDMGETGTMLYLSMEYLEGKTLGQMLRESGRIAPGEGIPVMKHVLQALHAAHREGVVHRDLKPENIMVDSRGQAHLMDVGLSIVLDEGRMTKSGALVGTPHYMAPEQFEGARPDHRVDIYAMGVILFRMFTGKHPFDADAPAQVMYGHLKLHAPKPSDVLPGIPPQLDAVILKALEKDPDLRYQSARELHQALKPFFDTLQDKDPVQEATVLMERRSFNLAMRLLRRALKRHPDQPQIREMYSRAVAAYLRKQRVLVVRMLKQHNLIHAQLTIERMINTPDISAADNERAQLLQAALNRRIDRSIRSYLAKAERHIDENRWQQAMACLTPARNLRPDHPGVLQFLQMIKPLLAEEEKNQTVLRIKEAGRMFQQKQEKEALEIVTRIIESDPSNSPAQDLRHQILRSQKLKEEEQQIAKQIKSAAKALAAADFVRAREMIDHALQETLDGEFSPALAAFQEMISEISRAFEQESFSSVNAIVERMLARDTHGLFSAHRAQFADLIRTAERMQKLRLRIISERIAEVLLLLLEGRHAVLSTTLDRLHVDVMNQHQEAVMGSMAAEFRQLQVQVESGHAEQAERMIESLLQTYPILQNYQAEMKRIIPKLKERRQAEWTKKYQMAQSLFQGKKWDEAGEAFRRLAEEGPDQQQLQEYIEQSAEKSRQQALFRERLKSAAEECGKHIANKNWDAALLCADYAMQGDLSEFVLKDEMDQLNVLVQRTKDARTLHTLEEAVRLRSVHQYERAAKLFQKVLSWEPHHADALEGAHEMDILLNPKWQPKKKPDRYAFLKRTLRIPEQYRIPAAVTAAIVALVWLLASHPPEGWIVWRANRLVKADRKDEAVSLLKGHLDRSPGSTKFQTLYKQLTFDPMAEKTKPILDEARRLRNAREYDRSIELYLQVLLIDSANSEATGELNYVQKLKADLETYLIDAETAFQNKQYSEAWKLLNQVLVLGPKYPPAEALLEKVRPHLVEELYQKGRELEKQGDYRGAESTLQEALNLNLENRKVRSALEQVRTKL